MKKLVILVGVDGQPSTRRVFSQMQTKDITLMQRRTPQNDKPYYRVYKDSSIENFEIKKVEHPNLEGMKVIRWGNRIEVTTDKSTLTYNNATAIKKSSNKGMSRELFIKNGVRTPQLYSLQRLPDVFPVIARPMTHSKGRDFVVLTDIDKFIEHYTEHEYMGWYYSEYIDKDREFRAYVAHGKLLGLAEKPRPQDGNQLAWNQAINHDSWRLLKWSEYPHDVCLQACKAVDALGLDFAGVDVVLKGTKAYVLESNTAPTVSDSPLMSLKFAKYFDWLNREENRRSHWDYMEYKKPESFAWKEFQLQDKKETV